MEDNTKEDQQPAETSLGAKSKFDPKLIAGGAIIIIVVIVGVFFLFGGQGQTPVPEQASITQEVPATPGSGVDEMMVEEDGDAMEEEEEGVMVDAREIVVEGSEFSFSPASISVKEGEKVKLTFNNAGSSPHNFTVQGLGVATRTIGAGESDTLEFTVEDGGTYATFCSVGNHRELGMEGVLKAQ